MRPTEEETRKAIKKDSRDVDVVVIDDDESMCEGCRQTLEGAGYKTATAKNGEEGLLLAARSHPRVVVVDLKMPDMSGIEVIARISKLFPNIAAILMSGYFTFHPGYASLQLGALDFIQKPFEPEQLLKAVRLGMTTTDDS